jgi:hypothetical protein
VAPTATVAATAKKEPTPQQQKMKDCAAKWGGGEEGQAGERQEGPRRIHEHVSERLTQLPPAQERASPRTLRGGFAFPGTRGCALKRMRSSRPRASAKNRDRLTDRS